MVIEDFVHQSIGEWSVMRSGHSLAFKQFEEVISTIKIRLLKPNDEKVKDLLEANNCPTITPKTPFEISWESNSDWEKDHIHGSSILIPIAKLKNSGVILRSKGYAEKIQAISKYSFSQDGTLKLTTQYQQTMAEERIWFLNSNVRCRSSVIKSANENAILQTSFASEIKKINQ